MRRMLLVLALLPVALPATAQTTLGLRAGFVVGKFEDRQIAGIVLDGLCLPDWDCPGYPTDGSVPAPAIGADIGFQLSGDGRIGIRLGGGFARAGGVAYGYDRHGNPLRGELSVSYLQFSALLRGYPWDLDEMDFLFGPWMGLPVHCTEEGAVAGSCADLEKPDAGLAFGAGWNLLSFSGSSFGLDVTYYHGLTDHWGGKKTRFVSLQLGLVFPIR